VQIPPKLLESLSGAAGFSKEAFEAVHAEGEPITSIRLNPSKKISKITDRSINQLDLVPWTGLGYYLDSRPSFTFDPLFHAGCYYVQEASSMFLEQALKQTVDLEKPLRVLDLSAAPGGKSTHIQSLISKDSLLVSNEVIRSRAKILKDNIIKWGTENVVVTNNDPAGFSALGNYFDVIVVDAPCSGSGLFRKDPEAVSEWSENNVQLCSQRQKRILADVLPALKNGGLLIYSTCSYSNEEDEEIVNWLLQEFALDHLPLNLDPSWGITDTGKGYRFWPDKVKGEGFFIACFQNRTERDEVAVKNRSKLAVPGNKELELIGKWVNKDGIDFIKHENTVYAWPQQLATEFALLIVKMKVLYSGVLAGELLPDKFLPDHALAMSRMVQNNVPRIELSREQAIRYLQRKDIEAAGTGRGWHLVTFLDQPLGWVNVLPNRINNYYPKELRILKESESSG
jgi:16S rRNA C967 or C1407 C5-methylase (RsmB/RsmF family)/NOL1/NOP2/fmu family ribosome biogenesis protein